jgi:hypothetical protein
MRLISDVISKNYATEYNISIGFSFVVHDLYYNKNGKLNCIFFRALVEYI